VVALLTAKMEEKKEINGCLGLFIAGLIVWSIVATLIILL